MSLFEELKRRNGFRVGLVYQNRPAGILAQSGLAGCLQPIGNDDFECR